MKKWIPILGVAALVLLGAAVQGLAEGVRQTTMAGLVEVIFGQLCWLAAGVNLLHRARVFADERISEESAWLPVYGGVKWATTVCLLLADALLLEHEYEILFILPR